MINPRIKVLSDEFALKRADLDALDTLAATEGRDLTDVERADYEAHVTRMDQIVDEIAVINKRQERFDVVAAATVEATPSLAHISNVNPRTPVSGQLIVPSMGEQIKIRALHSLGKDQGEYETLTRALAHGTTADGVAPTTIEGDLVKFVDANRYAVNASRQFPMPDNKAPTFLRPRKSTNGSVDVQATQGDVLSSTAPVVTSDTITKKTFGGAIALSEQEIDWTVPAMLQVAVEDLAEQYAIATDEELCDAIEAAVTEGTETICSLTAASDVFIAALGTAAQTVYSTAKKLPDTLFVAPDRWGYLLSLVDGDGRPLFPVSQAINSAGANQAGVTGFTGFNVLGLDVVVDPNFSSNIWIVAVRSLVESYEQNKGLLQIAAPSTLETTIAYRGYFATNVYAQGINGIEAA